MPNTLCHIALQTPASHLFRPKTSILLIVAACIIPDLPWIAQRLCLAAQVADPYMLRLYFTAQASLLFCLLPAALLALLAPRPRQVFVVVAANAALHLLLDATQEKWANGVHLLAPISWQPFSLGFSWPEHPLWTLLSCAGIAVMLFYASGKRGITVGSPEISGRRCVAMCIVATTYLLGPFAFLTDIEESNSHFIKTLRSPARTGSHLELDRQRYDAATATITTFAGEQIALQGDAPPSSGLLSVRGVFTSQATLQVTAYHIHSEMRDYASILGLFMACALGLQSVLLSRKKLHQPPQGSP